jgi:hypothetical protein
VTLLDGWYGQAFAINNAGVAVGLAEIPETGRIGPVTWR